MKEIEDKIVETENKKEVCISRINELTNETEELKERIKILEVVNAEEDERIQRGGVLVTIIVFGSMILTVGFNINALEVNNTLSSILGLFTIPAAVTAATLCAYIADINSRKLKNKKKYNIEHKTIIEQIMNDKTVSKTNDRIIKKYKKNVEYYNIKLEVLNDLQASIGSETKEDDVKLYEIKRQEKISPQEDIQLDLVFNEKKLSRKRTR